MRGQHTIFSSFENLPGIVQVGEGPPFPQLRPLEADNEKESQSGDEWRGVFAAKMKKAEERLKKRRCFSSRHDMKETH